MDFCSSRFWGTGQPDNYMEVNSNGEDCVMILWSRWNDNDCRKDFKRICESKSCRV